VQYGGKITDNMDRRLFNTYAQAWLQSTALEDPRFTFTPERPINPIPRDFRYVVLEAPEVDAYRRYANTFPAIDSPEIYGLHPNADLTFRNKEASYLLSTMAETQPKVGGGGGGPGGGAGGKGGGESKGTGSALEDAVLEKCSELLGRLPADYVEEEYKAAIRDIGGLTVPLNMFLFQEIQRLQRVIGKVRGMLKAIEQAIRGEVVMTSELQDAMADLYNAKVPRSWLYTPGGDEFSWLSPTLGLWFTMLVDRDDQNRSWLRHGRPSSFWMAGFSNPQGFLTAMKQEVTRANAAKKWALNDVVYRCEVQESTDPMRSPPKEGVFVHGLLIDGAKWDKSVGLTESDPKKLFSPLPVLHITAEKKGDAGGAAAGGAGGKAPLMTYDAPLYRYPIRTDKHLITTVALQTKRAKPQHWILRGVALLCIST